MAASSPRKRCDRYRFDPRHPMTQMSEPSDPQTPSIRANSARRLVRSAVARALHDRRVLRALVLTTMFAGCVIPPSLSVDTTDAGANSAPAIVSVRADNVELPELSTVTFERGMGTLVATFHDTDLDDTLYGKIFVDYTSDNPTPARSSCQSAGATVERTCTFDLTGLCQSADVGTERMMQVIVFDRQVLDTGQQPVYQAMAPGGISTSRVFRLRCQDRAP